MDDGNFTAILIFIAIILFLFFISYNCGYKKGQVDCLNGIIKYKKVKQDNGELRWKKHNSVDGSDILEKIE